jgi:hypothetical protein
MHTTDIARPSGLAAGLHCAPSRHDAATLWITGPRGAGPAGIARAIRSAIHSAGWPAALLDDDADAIASIEPVERARRAADAAASLVSGGVIAIVVIDCPRVRDRELARLTHEARRLPFFEIFVSPTTDARTAGVGTEAYEVPPLPDLVVFPGPVVGALTSVVAMLRPQDDCESRHSSES